MQARTRSILGWTGLTVALVVPLALSGAVDTFLKLGTLKGDAVDGSATGNHTGEIVVQSWSWEAANTTTIGGTTGAGAGKASLQPLSVTKLVDSSSPGILLAAMNGKAVGDSTLTLRKSTAGTTGGVEFMKLEMKTVYVTDIKTTSGDDFPSETVQVVFGSFRLTYTPQDPTTGKPGTPIQSIWSIINNNGSF